MHIRITLMVIAGMATGAGLATPALAGETPFNTLYTAEVLPAGEAELGQTEIARRGKPHQSYDAVESRTEIEYGLSSDFQLAGYANYTWQRERFAGAAAQSGLAFTSFSLEAIYQVLDPDTRPFGLALYIEPAYGPDSREIEGRVLLQKNLFDDRLVLAANAVLEHEWTRDAGLWHKGTELRALLGAAWRVAPGWSAGAEFEAKREYDGILVWGRSAPAADSFFIGPTLNYATEDYSITLGAQAQIPWAANLSGKPGETVGGFAHEEERYRVQLRIEADL